ncbi:MAG: response regulator transcription factor [Bacteroidetes bacterium]|nr:response regulator transcription factor [Bacteroidota bacterium]
MNRSASLRKQPLILIVDDEPDILDLLQYNLKKEKYDTIVALDGQEGIEKAQFHQPDLIVLDIMMPRLDGLEAVKSLRQNANLREIPILMLTARGSEADHVVGLDSGADIYLSKPISIPVFLSQVKALLRGVNHPGTSPNILKLGDLVIDKDRYEARLKDVESPVHLARKEFDLLFFLAQKPGRVFSRQELLDRVWGSDVYVVDRTVDVHIRKIREKIGDHYIETVKGVGYRLASRLDEN